MPVEVKELLSGMPVTEKMDPASIELIEIIKRLVDAVRDLEARVEALEP